MPRKKKVYLEKLKRRNKRRKQKYDVLRKAGLSHYDASILRDKSWSHIELVIGFKKEVDAKTKTK